MTTEKLDPAHTLNAPFGFTDREKSAWSYGYREGHAAALASSPQPAEPAEKESQCTNGTLNTWQSQLDTAASGATPTRDATSAALAAPASSIQAGNSPESGSIQAEVPPGPFDHLAGRGLHELRFDELTPYVLTILEDPAAVEAAVAWIVSELTRKTNDERILAVQLAALREAASPPSAPVEAPKLHARTADLVQRFSKALAEKLADAERKYGYADGWADNDWMDNCRESLMEHIVKGDPRDVAAYCAFLWHHGESTTIKRRRPCPFCVGRTGMVSSTCEDCLGSGELPVSTSPSAPAQVPGWKLIETAPKDGTRILAICMKASKPEADIVFWGPGWRPGDPEEWGRLAARGWKAEYDELTHWQPLPPPPVSAPTVGKENGNG